MKCLRTGTAIFLLCACSAIKAGEIQQASVVFARDIYTVKFDGLIYVAPSEVYRLVTDHDHLYRLNDIVMESTLLTRTDASIKKRRVIMHICILIFCRDMKLVESLQENGKDELIATVVPAESDFRSGRTVWQVMPAGVAQSRLQLHSTFRPAFWVPPVIGPWLIRNKMEQELSVMMVRLEQYAEQDHGH